jgi:hypothetical protein
MCIVNNIHLVYVRFARIRKKKDNKIYNKLQKRLTKKKLQN